MLDFFFFSFPPRRSFWRSVLWQIDSLDLSAVMEGSGLLNSARGGNTKRNEG